METIGRLPELRHLGLWSRYTPVVSSSIVGGDGRHLFHKLRSVETNLHLRVQRVHGVAPNTAIMPSVEVLRFRVPVRFLKDANLGFDKIGLENLPSLPEVTAHIDCWLASAAEVEEEEAALRHAAAVHPNHPTLRMERMRENEMLSTDDQLKARRAYVSC